MRDEANSSASNEIGNFVNTVVSMKQSLHTRKWASIYKKSSVSNASTPCSISQNVDHLSKDNFSDSQTFSITPDNIVQEQHFESIDEESGESQPDVTSEYEISSRTKRKMSRDPGVFEGATRAVTEMLAGVSGVDILSDVEDDFSNDILTKRQSDRDLVEVPNGFKRRNTRRLQGPSGEKIILHGSTFRDKDDQQNNFGLPLLNSTFLPEKARDEDLESVDSSDNSPSVLGSPPADMSFDSTDLPLYNNVAPIPRILTLQQGDSGKRTRDEGTTSDSEDMYSSHNSSQSRSRSKSENHSTLFPRLCVPHNHRHSFSSTHSAPSPHTQHLLNKADLMNSILPPIHSQSVRTTAHKEEPDFEELERYFPSHQMSLFIGTWNMHSEKEVPLLVEEFLMPPECEYLQDMYVIGTQECTPHKREWEVTVQATLGPTHVLVRSESLGDIHLIIMVRREMIWIMRDVQSSTVACGAGGVMRNKGAVGIVLTVFGSSILFITAHLRAHTTKVKERNVDAVRIATSLDFSRYNSKQTSGEELTLDCTENVDCVFWSGDLNYRVTCERDVAEKAIQSNNLEPLIKNDQLLEQIREKAAFRGFSEAPISFPPTFKFDPGSVEYDTSAKQRVPSWTDRILYKSRQDSITPQIYHYCPTLTFSDHRPVFGVYLVTLKPSPISSTLRATGWFDKRAYARGMKRRQLCSRTKPSGTEGHPLNNRKLKQSSFVMKAVNAPVKKVMANHKSSVVCSIM
ncbi:hypothetical protein ACHWQZ_G016251 [Mnemiopsis leidyi]